MSKPKLTLGIFLLLCLMSLAGASSGTVHIFPVNSGNLSQGFNIFIDTSAMPGGFSMNFSDQLNLNITGASTVHITTSTGTSTLTGDQHFIISAPAGCPKINANVALGYGGNFINGPCNANVAAPQQPSFSGNILLTKCGTSNTLSQNSISVTANAPPCANLTVIKQVNATTPFTYNNPTWGASINITAQPFNRHIDLLAGDNVTLPGNLTVDSKSPNVTETLPIGGKYDFGNIHIRSVNASSLVKDNASMAAIFNYVAGLNCTVGGLVTYQNAQGLNVSICHHPLNMTNDNPFVLGFTVDNLDKLGFQGIGQSWVQSFTFADEAAAGWHTNYTILNRTTTQLYNDIYGPTGFIAQINGTGGLREQLNTTRHERDSAYNTNISDSVVVAVVVGGSVFFGKRIARFNKREKRLKVHEEQEEE